MFKRALSFIIILASVVILSYTLFAGNLFSGLIGTSKTSSYSYDYSVDKKGNIYYIQNGSDGQKDMIGLDSSGRQFCKKSIASVAGVDNVVDSIYVTQDDTLLMVVYHLMPGTEYFDNVTVDQFRDDGSFAGQVFQKTISKRYDGKYRVISSMSDDDNSIYFGVLNDSQIITYSVKKSTGVLQQSANLRLSVNPNNINAFLVLPSEDVVMSLSGGLIVKETAESAVQNYTFSGNPQVIITNFWYAGEQFYCRDEVSGNLYLSLDGELNPSCVMQGEKDISSGKGTKFSQLNDIAVGTSGNLIGVSNSNGVSHIYDGGLEFFPEVAQTDNSQSGSLTLWLLFFGVAAGIVILSLLIWDFYCNVLHMQISLLFRQTLLVFFVLYCSIYLLSNFMIKPETSKAFNGGNQTEVEQYVQTVSDMFQSSLTTSGSKQLDSTIVNDFFTRFASTQKNENALKSSHIFLFVKSGLSFDLLASGDQYENGLPATSLEYTRNITSELSQTTNKIQTVTVSSREGDMLCTMVAPNVTYEEYPTLLLVVTPTANLGSNIDHMVNTITFYLRLIGAGLLLLLIFVECITTFSLKKLRKDVDIIAGGNYAFRIDIHSGDEVEALSKSITTLSNNSLSASKSLYSLNTSYYRFVPQKFLATIGETHIESVQKNSQAFKENAVMMFLRFRFTGSSGENSEQIFSNINSVFEKIVPVVNESNGTIYNFLPEGLNAVFENEPAAVLQSAFRIREVIDGLNKERADHKNLGGDVDVRIFITIGNIMLGFVGDETRMEPTAISEAARKAESITKICFESSIYVACTRDFIESIKNLDYRSRSIGKVMLQQEELELFDFYESDPYAVTKVKELYADRFEMGVNLFAKGDYRNALTMFMEIVKYSTIDGASRNYMVLSEYNLHSNIGQHSYTTADEFEKLHRLAGMY